MLCRMKWLLVIPAAIAFASPGGTARAAQLAQITLSGTTAGGNWVDYIGAFGDAGINISNTPVTAVVTYDTNPADYTIDTSVVGVYTATSAGVGGSTDPATAGFISIAETINGQTYTFVDALGGTIRISSSGGYGSMSISVNQQSVYQNPSNSFAEVGFGSGTPDNQIDPQTGLSQSFLFTSLPFNFSPADICAGPCGSALVNTWYDTRWGTAQTNSGSVDTPEPSSVALLAVGLAAIGGLRRSRLSADPRRLVRA